MKRRPTVSVLLGGVAIAILLASGCRGDGKQETTISDEAPTFELPIAQDFELEAIDGSTFRLADHAGYVVVINFWATWCAPCREEIPDFIELSNDFSDEGLRFVGVSIDEVGEGVVRDFVAEFDISYPIAMDADSVAARYGGHYAVPTTFVVGRAGRIRHRVIGKVAGSTLRPILERLLREEQPST